MSRIWRTPDRHAEYSKGGRPIPRVYKKHAKRFWRETMRESRRWREGAGRMAHWVFEDGQLRWHDPRPWKKPHS